MNKETQKFNLENSVQGEQLLTWRTVRFQSKSAYPTPWRKGVHGEQFTTWRTFSQKASNRTVPNLHRLMIGEQQLTRKTVLKNRGTSLHHLMRRTATDKANKVQKWRTQKFHLENSVQGEQLMTWRTVRLQSHSACPTSLMIGEPQRLKGPRSSTMERRSSAWRKVSK